MLIKPVLRICLTLIFVMTSFDSLMTWVEFQSSSFSIKENKGYDLWDKGLRGVTPVVEPPCAKHFGWVVNDW